MSKSKDAQRAATVALVEAARMDSLPYTPWVTGDLARSADVASKPEAGLLIYDTPYARAQYYGLPMKTEDFHALAMMQWFEEAKAVNGASWRRIAESEYSRFFGG
jgi:hypothetical protein